MKTLLLTILSWASAIIPIFLLLIALLAYCKKREANQLTREKMSQFKKQERENKKNQIIENIISGWKNPGARQVLISAWKINEKKALFTMQEFNEIWEAAYLAVKGKSPRESAKTILANHMDENI